MIVFSGDVNLLVASPTFQEVLIDKDGSPMSGGTITCYHDNTRTTLKNWYYQVGSGGSYIYIALPNPLTLSAAGTICDINGVDTIPFFYPYDLANNNSDDPYYITIVNYEKTNQITRENFPFIPPQGAVTETINTFNNLIINPGFWRNIQPNTVNITPYTSVTLNSILQQDSQLDNKYVCTVAPSQHDGFRYSDIKFIKNNVSGNDVVTFTPFPLGTEQPISNNIAPEYYVNHVCNSPGSSETIKCYQFPISLHINTLANVPFTFSIQAQNAGGTNVGQNAITIFIYQDTGSAGTPIAPIEIEQFILTPGWDLYTATGVFPSTAGLNLSLVADDALYLQVQMPLNTNCAINFTKPSIYLTSGLLPTNNFQTYDQVDTVINSPRTGDIRTSLNSFYYFGWIPMNDGTIGNSSSNSSCRANTDTWPLYNLIWQLAKPYDTGSSFNAISTIYTSASSATNYGSSAINDFNANKQLLLTRALGRVLMGAVPLGSLGFGRMTSVSNPSGTILLFTLPSGNNLFQGAPVTFVTSGTLPGGVVSNFVYYATQVNTSLFTFQIANTYANALAGTALTYSSSGTGTLTSYIGQAGAATGEYAHQQLSAEVGAHTHPATTTLSSVAISNVASGGLTNFVAGSATSSFVAAPPFSSAVFSTNVNANADGSSFNIVQPAAFYNTFIKL